MINMTKDEERDIERAFLRIGDAIAALAFVDDETLPCNIGPQIAIARGNLEEAKEHLIAVGKLIRQEAR